MMQELLLKAALMIVVKLLNETFMSRALIAILNAWAKSTANDLDDKVVAAMAEALGVPVEKLKE